MGSLTLFSSTNMLMIYSILLVIVLAIILVLAIFTFKYKSYHDKNNYIKSLLDDCNKKGAGLQANLDNEKQANIQKSEKIAGIDEMKKQFKKELDRLHGKIAELEKSNTEAMSSILELEKTKSELEANIVNAKDNEESMQDKLSEATKRNEFWVAQMSELRVKYEALQLKLR